MSYMWRSSPTSLPRYKIPEKKILKRYHKKGHHKNHIVTYYMMKILIYDYNSCYGVRYNKHGKGREKWLLRLVRKSGAILLVIIKIRNKSINRYGMFKVEKFLLAEIDKIMLALGEFSGDGEDEEGNCLEIFVRNLTFWTYKIS